eukprot:gnl/TRDRNA2_/TRDRNA2_40590_c0_seq1.p1 gnl/TRDRNA2_/TRDRNA2_40590_c0~~gnl/TRDRNA2_/TRDRNA2_40590_c0_seq1.p1  ORF type:complete len:312 (+),score=33.64 gnl/TRDRNA2_/TRDRNA2_40590_c0_seq1:1-936(+)
MQMSLRGLCCRRHRRKRLIEVCEVEPRTRRKRNSSLDNDEQLVEHTDVLQRVCICAAISGETLYIDLRPHARLKDVKKDIEQNWGIPPREQKLIVNGTTPDEECPVLKCRVRNVPTDITTIEPPSPSLQGNEPPLVISCLRVRISDFQLGDRVVAVKDSNYLEWRKAGDEGTICDWDKSAGMLSVFWHRHKATSPFDASDDTLDPYDMLRIISECPKLIPGDLVVTVANSVCVPWLRAGDEGTVETIDSSGTVSVHWSRHQQLSKFHVSSRDLARDTVAKLRRVFKAERSPANRAEDVDSLDDSIEETTST